MDQAPPKYKRMLGFTPKRVGDLWKELEDTDVSIQSAVKRAEGPHCQPDFDSTQSHRQSAATLTPPILL